MNDNRETVADIVAELRKGVKDWKGDTLHIFDDLADRIERAHGREILRLRECLREAVAVTCYECIDIDIAHCRGRCYVAKWRDALAEAGGEGGAK